MTVFQLKAVSCAAQAYALKFLPYITDACVKYDILSPQRQLSFLAQVSHESGGLYYTEELASGTAYEGRADLGNTQPGDGEKFKGRGLIQITGRNNYSLIGTAFGIDLLADPALLAGRNINLCTPDQLKWAAMSAGWFWNRTGLNHFADQINLQEPVDEGANLENFKEITRKINGGYNGLPDRLHRFKEGVALFASTAPLTPTS